jgi:hypothetical protein
MRRLLLMIVITLALPACCIDVPFVPFVVDPTIAPAAGSASPSVESPR